MEMKEWEVLLKEEYDYVWNSVMDRFKFNPRYNSSNNDLPFLKLPELFQVYEMHLFTSYLKDKSIIINEDYYNVFNEHITNIFIKCMANDEFLYALDWQHTCFRYNPKSSEKMPHMLETNGYNIYFPDFYPDGDYHFFIAKDFSWGYFTHPWTQELWVFGEDMVEEIKKVPPIYLTLKA